MSAVISVSSRKSLSISYLRKTAALAVLATFLLSAPSAKADCPAVPIASTDDMVVSFVASQGGTQIGPSTIFSSSVKEGMLVYDDATNALKLCDGTTWTALGSGGGSAAGTVAGAVQFRGATAVLAADDANFVWDDTNNRLGIGTVAPDEKFQVADAVTNLKISIKNTTSTTGRDWTLNSASSGKFYIGDDTEPANRLVIDTSGHVGIGTTGPNASALLDVTSTTKGLLPPRMTTAQVTAVATPADGLIVYDTDTDTIKLRANGAWVSLTSGTFSESDPQVGAVTNNLWCRGDGSAIQCDQTAPSVSVSDGDKGDVTVSGTGATWTIDADAVTYSKLQNVATDRLLGRATAGAGDAEEITLGTGLSFTGTTLNVGTLGASSVAADSLDFTEFKDAMALDASTDIAVDNAEVFSISNIGTGISFRVNDEASDTTPFVVDASGNVGIGTTTPGYLLHVQREGTSASTVIETNNSTGRSNLQLHTSSGTAAAKTAVASGRLIGEWLAKGYDGGSYQDAAQILGVVDAAVSSGIVPGQLRFSTSDVSGVLTERLRINSSGNVGIGTTTLPTVANPKLTIAPSGAGSGLGIAWNYSGGTGETDFINYGQGGNGGFQFYNYALNGGAYPAAAPTALMTILGTNGNVGIGTSTPSVAKLQIAGVGTETGQFTAGRTLGVQNTTAAASIVANQLIGSIGFYNNVSVAVAGLSAHYKANADGAQSYLTFKTGNTPDQMLIDSNGNVGIGTTTPSTALEVVGTVKSSGPLWSSFGSTGTHRGLLLENFDNTANTHGVDIAAKLGGTEFQGLSWVKETAWTTASAGTAKDTMLQFGVLTDNAATIPMVIKSDGNVGIGTASPQAKLDVRGDLWVRQADASYVRVTSDATVASINFNNTNNLRFMFNDVTEVMRMTSTGNVGIGGTANASALLDVSSTTKGFLPPRMTTAQVTAVATPADGLMVYDIDTDTIKLRANSAWVSLAAGSSAASGAAGYLQISGGSGAFASSSTAAGQQLFWDTTNHRLGIGTTSPSRKLEVAGQIKHSGTMADAARPICYSALGAGNVNHSIIMVPLPAAGSDLDSVCHTNINASWHAGGIVKGNYFNQDCTTDIDNQSFGGGYTSYLVEATYEGAPATYANCGPTNAIVCCSTSFPN